MNKNIRKKIQLATMFKSDKFIEVELLSLNKLLKGILSYEKEKNS